MEQSKIVDFEEKDIGGEVELPNFARKYAAIKTEIEGYEIREGRKFDDKQSYYLIAYTKVIAKEAIKDKETKSVKEIEIKASKLFGILKQEGKFVWGSQSDLAGFLKKHKITSIKELKGLKVITTTQEGKGDNKDKEYLSFI